MNVHMYVCIYANGISNSIIALIQHEHCVFCDRSWFTLTSQPLQPATFPEGCRFSDSADGSRFGCERSLG